MTFQNTVGQKPKKWLSLAVSVLLVAQSLAPFAANASSNAGKSHAWDDGYGSRGRNDSYGHHDRDDKDDHDNQCRQDDNHSDDHGTIEDSKITPDIKGIRLSATYGQVGGQPTAAGAFSDAATNPTALGGYTEGSCVPLSFSAKNTSTKKGDVRYTLVYNFGDDAQMGIDDLEKVSIAPSGNPATVVDNLNDVILTGAALPSTTSFRMDNGVSIVANIQGPFAGDNTGKTKIKKNQNGIRHYNVILENVPAGRTVYGVACARISMDEDPGDDYLNVGMRLGGHIADQALIKTSSLLRLPSLTLEAQVNSPGATPDQFTFHVTPPINGTSTFPIPHGLDKIKITNVPPTAAYTITETGPAGYAFTSGTGTNCTFSGSTATAHPAAGTTPVNATCTFISGQTQVSQATLKVTKVVVNDNGGTKVVANFPLYVNGNSVTSGVSKSFAPGTYAVTEDTTPDYIGTFSGDCDATGHVTLTAGSNKSCTLTNNDQLSYIVVTKQVINDNGGTKTVADFPLLVDGTSVTSSVPAAFAPGTHQVSELTDRAYAATFSGDCDANGNITLSLGQTKQCLITNNDIAPTLTVIKDVVNDNGGTKTAADFALFVNGGAVTSGVANSYTSGTYQVTETADPGYSGSFSGDCDANGNVSLTLGDTKECILTNDDKPSSLIVTNTVINDNGGTKTVADFPVLVDGNGVNLGVETQLNSGPHAVTVQNDYFYAVSFAGDCDANGNVTVNPGMVAHCNVTTNDPSAKLTIHKVVINDSGGLKTTADFQAYLGAMPVDGDMIIPLSEGTYVVNERPDSFYIETYSGDCDASGKITLQSGDNKICTITDNDAPAGLTVVTRVINDNTGTLQPSNFTAFVQAVGSGGIIAGSADGVTLEIGGGSFSVGQFFQDGYFDPSFEGSCFGFIQPGDGLVCTITNNDF